MKKFKKIPKAPYKNFFWPTIPIRQQGSSIKQQAIEETVPHNDIEEAASSKQHEGTSIKQS